MYLNETVLNYVLEDEKIIELNDEKIKLKKQNLGLLNLPTGRIVANDSVVIFENEPFQIAVPKGEYLVSIIVAEYENTDKRVALAVLKFSDKKPVKWEMALLDGQKLCELEGEEDFFGYGVDSGIGGFMDKQTVDKIEEEGIIVYDKIEEEFEKNYVDTYSAMISSLTSKNDIAFISSGWGDGGYPSFFAFDENNNPCLLVTDFLILNEGDYDMECGHIEETIN